MKSEVSKKKTKKAGTPSSRKKKTQTKGSGSPRDKKAAQKTASKIKTAKKVTKAASPKKKISSALKTSRAVTSKTSGKKDTKRKKPASVTKTSAKKPAVKTPEKKLSKPAVSVKKEPARTKTSTTAGRKSPLKKKPAAKKVAKPAVTKKKVATKPKTTGLTHRKTSKKKKTTTATAPSRKTAAAGKPSARMRQKKAVESAVSEKKTLRRKKGAQAVPAAGPKIKRSVAAKAISDKLKKPVPVLKPSKQPQTKAEIAGVGKKTTKEPVDRSVKKVIGRRRVRAIHEPAPGEAEAKEVKPSGEPVLLEEPPKKKEKRSLPLKPEKTGLKIFLPEEQMIEEEYEESVAGDLNEEYGDNEIVAMAVDPRLIFVSWEIKKEDARAGRGTLMLRVSDVTGIDFDGSNAHSFMDINIGNRIGSGFYEIMMPGRDVIIELGFFGSDGTFRGVLRSDKISIPKLIVPDELGIAQKLSESGVPLGYKQE